jgi:hypothetical protein
MAKSHIPSYTVQPPLGNDQVPWQRDRPRARDWGLVVVVWLGGLVGLAVLVSLGVAILRLWGWA